MNSKTFSTLYSKKTRILALALFVVVFTCFVLTGCSFFQQQQQEDPKEDDGSDDARFLSVSGDKIRTNKGTGGEVYLRGVNAGGLFVIEQWMNGFTESTDESFETTVAKDHYTTTKVFIERFGYDEAKALWEEYIRNWWSDIDFQNCVDMGINVIRLPFTYMTVDFAAVTGWENAGKGYDFTLLDEFVQKAEQYGLYVILDLHGAYGSQNGKDHSGQELDAEDVDFYSNTELQELTCKLWKATAEHFKDNATVAAYDILNEPAETTGSGTQTTEKRHWDVFDKIYDAIREVDDDHIVIFESCWGGENLPQPSKYGWENCMYSFHHYTGSSDYETHIKSWEQRIADIASQNFGVPIYMGEFCCYHDEDSWRNTLEAMNRLGWHWTSWTYKINNSWGNSAWGIVRVEATDESKVNAHTDSYDTIVEKFQNLKTTENAIKYTFSSGTTLRDVLKEYCVQNSALSIAEISNGTYTFTTADGTGLALNATVGVRKALSLSVYPTDFTVEMHSDGDGSFYLITEGSCLTWRKQTDGYYVAVLDSSRTDEARFFLSIDEDGDIVISSYITGEYLAWDEEHSLVRPCARNKKDALKFTINEN